MRNDKDKHRLNDCLSEGDTPFKYTVNAWHLKPRYFFYSKYGSYKTETSNLPFCASSYTTQFVNSIISDTERRISIEASGVRHKSYCREF